MASDFSLSKILEITGRGETRKKDIIEYHYKQAKLRIRDAYINYEEFCYYTVPEFVSRLPTYDCNEIAIKLVKYMKSKGFDCKVIFTNKIIFEWEPKKRPKDHIPFLVNNLYKRIEQEAKNNNDYLFYEVPTILPEFPWYNTKDTTEELSKNLINKSFIVKTLDNVMFICWNKEQLEKKSNIKINFETREDKRKKAMEDIELINENRYSYFINPKKNKKSKIDFEDTEGDHEEDTNKTNKFDVNRVLHLY